MDTDFSSSAIVINSDGMGHADEALRHKLLSNYLHTVAETGRGPATILLYAAGVRMATRDAPCRAELTRLAEAGSRIIVCRTCLEFYGLLDQVPDSDIGNMLMIVEAQSQADKVITL